MTSIHQQAVWDAAKALGEKNDCAVKAVAMATGEPYDKVHALMAKHGRRKGSGTEYNITRKVLAELGYELVSKPVSEVKPGSLWGCKTLRVKHIREFSDHFKQFGTVLVGQPAHIAAMIDGVVYDWSANRMKQVDEFYLVRKL